MVWAELKHAIRTTYEYRKERTHNFSFSSRAWTEKPRDMFALFAQGITHIVQCMLVLTCAANLCIELQCPTQRCVSWSLWFCCRRQLLSLLTSFVSLYNSKFSNTQPLLVVSNYGCAVDRWASPLVRAIIILNITLELGATLSAWWMSAHAMVSSVKAMKNVLNCDLAVDGWSSPVIRIVIIFVSIDICAGFGEYNYVRGIGCSLTLLNLAVAWSSLAKLLPLVVYRGAACCVSGSLQQDLRHTPLRMYQYKPL